MFFCIYSFTFSLVNKVFYSLKKIIQQGVAFLYIHYSINTIGYSYPFYSVAAPDFFFRGVIKKIKLIII